MRSDLPIAREIRLAAHPSGPARARDFELVRTPPPSPRPGEVVVRNEFFHVSPSLRPLLAAEARSEPGVPFSPIRVGDPLQGFAVGVVEVALGTGGPRVDDRVLHPLGWREFATVRAADCRPVGTLLPDPMMYLGHLWTAFAATTYGAPVRTGDRVFVSSAGSAIGALAGPIARLYGARRVIGSTSTPEKAARIRDELGYDAVVTRIGKPIRDQVLDVAPDGLDVVIDLVGGEQLSAALALARDGARIAVMGSLGTDFGSAQATATRFDERRFLDRRVSMRGYSADDDVWQPAWEAICARWLRSGDLRFPSVVVDGIEHAPQAFIDAEAGRHLGTVIIRL